MSILISWLFLFSDSAANTQQDPTRLKGPSDSGWGALNGSEPEIAHLSTSQRLSNGWSASWTAPRGKFPALFMQMACRRRGFSPSRWGENYPLLGDGSDCWTFTITARGRRPSGAGITVSGVTPRDAEWHHAGGEVLSSTLADLCLVGKLVVAVFQFRSWDNMFKLLDVPSALGIRCKDRPGDISNISNVKWRRSAKSTLCDATKGQIPLQC